MRAQRLDLTAGFDHIAAVTGASHEHRTRPPAPPHRLAQRRHRGVSAAILIGAEVFGAAFAGSWAFATLFDLGGIGARMLDVVFVLCGVAIMVQFVRSAHLHRAVHRARVSRAQRRAVRKKLRKICARAN